MKTLFTTLFMVVAAIIVSKAQFNPTAEVDLQYPYTNVTSELSYTISQPDGDNAGVMTGVFEVEGASMDFEGLNIGDSIGNSTFTGNLLGFSDIIFSSKIIITELYEADSAQLVMVCYESNQPSSIGPGDTSNVIWAYNYPEMLKVESGMSSVFNLSNLVPYTSTVTINNFRTSFEPGNMTVDVFLYPTEGSTLSVSTDFELFDSANYGAAITGSQVNPVVATVEENVLAGATVKNKGVGMIPGGNVMVYLSIDGMLDPDEDLLLTTIPFDTLMGEETVAIENTTVFIPAEAPAGIVNYIFDLKINGPVEDGDISDNRGTYFAFVNQEGGEGGGTTSIITDCDIAVEDAEVDLEVVIPGNEIAVSSTLQNQGTELAYLSEMHLFLSEDETWDEEDMPIGEGIINTIIPPDSSISAADNSVLIAEDTPLGEYFVLLVQDPDNELEEDESERENNIAAVPLLVNRADYEVTELSAEPLRADTNLLFTGSMVNNEESLFGQSVKIDFYVNHNGASYYLDGSSVFMPTSGSTDFEILADYNVVPPCVYGNAQIIAKTDEDENIQETNEDNNFFSTNVYIEPINPDLAFDEEDGLEITLSTYEPGQSINISSKVKNQGSLSVTDPVNVSYYLSMDQTYDGDDVMVGETVHNGSLNCGNAYVDEFSGAIPGDIELGQWYLIAVADKDDNVSEHREFNNEHALELYITIDPDLAINNAVISPDPVGSDIEMTVNVDFENLSQGPFGTSHLRFFYSDDDSWNPEDDQEFGYSAFIESLEEGESRTEEVMLYVPDCLEEGTHYLIAVADYDDRILETDEDNNVLVFEFEKQAGDADFKLIEGRDGYWTYNLYGGRELHSPGGPWAFSPVIAGETTATGVTFFSRYDFSGDITIDYYLSKDSEIDAEDELLYTHTESGASCGSAVSVQNELTIPPLTEPGSYRIIFSVNTDESIPEVSYDDNLQSESILVIPSPLQANFSYEVSGNTVNFTNTSSGNVTNLQWSLGEGNSSSENDPSHDYSEVDNYNVCLTIQNTEKNYMARICKTIVMNADLPFADFSYQPGNGDFTFDFSDESTGDFDTWFWETSAGHTSNDQNPSFDFEQSGAYEVCLTVVNETTGKQSQKCISLSIGGNYSPLANFLYYLDIEENIADFHDLSTGQIDQWYWYFDDGAYRTYELQKDTIHHQFGNNGMYEVKLSTYREATQEQSSFTRDVQIGDNILNADFSYVVKTSTQTVLFDDKTTGSPNLWYWEFGDGTTSDEQNPEHVYDDFGSYYVTMHVFDEVTRQSDSKTYRVQVGDLECDANFNYVINDKNLATFTDRSRGKNLNNWYWDMGDGTTYNAARVQHQYTKPGIYEVKLTVTNNQGCSDTQVEVIQVGDAGCKAKFEQFVDLTTQEVEFTNTSLGNPTSVYWEFGDGNTSNEVSPIHTYPAPGNYNVRLTISGNGCSDSYTKRILVGDEGFDYEADFNFVVDGGTVSFFNQSTGSNITDFAWTFGDNKTSIEENPVHEYETSGYKEVCLTIFFSDGETTYSNTTCKYVLVDFGKSEYVLADFSYIVDGNTVELFDESLGKVDSWTWEFPDGSTVSAESATNTFDEAGYYPINLHVMNTGGGTQDTRTKLVKVGDVESTIKAMFRYEQDENAAMQINFNGMFYGDPSNFTWDFGDGNEESLALSPVHQYADSGYYDVCFTITDPIAGLEDTYCETIYVKSSAGIGENNLISEMKVYPNPAKNVAYLRFNLLQPAPLRISLMKMDGTVVSTFSNQTFRAGSHIEQLSITDMPNGIYFIRMQGQRTTITKKLVILR